MLGSTPSLLNKLISQEQLGVFSQRLLALLYCCNGGNCLDRMCEQDFDFQSHAHGDWPRSSEAPIREKSKRRTLLRWVSKKYLWVSLLSVLTSTGVHAEPLALEWQDESKWRYSITAYGFLPFSTDGTSTIAGSSVDLDLDFGDAVDLLDFAIAGRFEAWKGDWGLIVDANYVELSAGDTIALEPGPSIAVDADIRQAWLGLLATYRIANSTYGASDRRFSFDIQGGARYNRLKQEIDITTPGPNPSLGGTEEWWEPVVGGRAVWELDDEWNAAVAADFGGFGAGGNDLQVGINAGFSRRIGKTGSLRLGYRYYSIDFSEGRSDGDFALDMKQHGPYIGFTWRLQ